LFSDKIIVVAYISGTKANISLRGKNIREITLKAIEGIENARGGGHKDATGAQMNVEDLPRFKENVERLIK
jgi:oligoribonuclease NrnB/cAMP/cGMP phosphodiesterase (DHH superfamily)